MERQKYQLMLARISNLQHVELDILIETSSWVLSAPSDGESIDFQELEGGLYFRHRPFLKIMGKGSDNTVVLSRHMPIEEAGDNVVSMQVPMSLFEGLLSPLGGEVLLPWQVSGPLIWATMRGSKPQKGSMAISEKLFLDL
jgi:hypothetical protein